MVDVLVLVAFFSSLVFALVHLFSNRIYRYSERHRSKMLSLFGGITVAYVFLDLLPRLETTRVHLERLFGAIPAFLNTLAIPGFAFAGFLVFFILEHFALKTYRAEHSKNGKPGRSTIYAFAIHFVTIVFLSLVIGYILRFEAQTGAFQLLLYTAALSLHFVILDHTMESHYKRLYVRFGRYFASLMPIIGWGLSVFFPESHSVGYLLLAVILGVILFNSIKDTVPKGGGKDPVLFVAGALLYSALLLTAAWLGSFAL